MRSCRYLAALAMVAGLLLCSAASATPQDELEKTQQDIAQSRARQAELAGKSQALAGELQALQEKLVRLAASMQKNEADLSASEDRLRTLDSELQAKSDALKADRRDLDGLVRAALRLSRMPPEAMIMMPGDITQTIKAARALKMTSDAIRRETESIGLQMAELQQLKEKAAREHDEISRRQAALDDQHRQLMGQLSQRKALQARLGREQKKLAAKLARLAQRAEDLQDLVLSLEREEEQNHQAVQWQRRDYGAVRGQLRSFDDAKGRIRSPAAGRVVRSFGVADGRDGTSKGVVIATRPGAQVTAPYDGEVVFTGPFLNYGLLVIIRHSDGFHTLLAGLDKIDTSVGQFLLEGEPIGAMGDNASVNRLYVELRKNNQPVDPAPWISGLNRK